MVFWKTYPFSILLESLFPSKPFHALVFDKEPIPSPTGQDAQIATQDDIPWIRKFLQSYFGNPPHTPILDIPESELLSTHDFLFYVKHDNIIIGCIRYHFLGTMVNSTPMYLVDCFCIHPDWRKKGISDYLLITLHQFANQKKIPYCLFLKEGPSLSILCPPLYTGRYAFRAVEIEISNHLRNISVNEANRLINVFQKLFPNVFIIRNHKTTNQHWRFYKKDSYLVLACVQDTYQWFMEKGQRKKMGWITCWLESPMMQDSTREEVSIQIANSMNGQFDYVWTNHAWTGYSRKWKQDGAFHWYSYQWTTSNHVTNQYCIVH